MTTKPLIVYYTDAAAISMVDEQFGKIISTLDELQLSERSIVAFVGDHVSKTALSVRIVFHSLMLASGCKQGQNLGEKNMFSKMTLYETSLRAPMIMRAPGAKPRVIRAPVEFLSIYPTLVSLAGLTPPVHGIGDIEGVDLSPLILGKDDAVEPTAAYSQVTRCQASYNKEIGPCSGEFGLTNASQFDWMGMSVRTPTHRYVEWREWDGPRLAPVWSGEPVAVELYAHDADDGNFETFVNGESLNIASETDSLKVRKRLESQIRSVFGPKSG